MSRLSTFIYGRAEFLVEAVSGVVELGASRTFPSPFGVIIQLRVLEQDDVVQPPLVSSKPCTRLAVVLRFPAEYHYGANELRFEDDRAVSLSLDLRQQLTRAARQAVREVFGLSEDGGSE